MRRRKLTAIVRSFLGGMHMTTLADAVRNIKAPRPYFLAALGILLLLATIALYNLGESHRAELSKSISQQRALDNELAGRAYAPAAMKAKLSAYVQTAGIVDS